MAGLAWGLNMNTLSDQNNERHHAVNIHRHAWGVTLSVVICAALIGLFALFGLSQSAPERGAIIYQIPASEISVLQMTDTSRPRRRLVSDVETPLSAQFSLPQSSGRQFSYLFSGASQRALAVYIAN